MAIVGGGVAPACAALLCWWQATLCEPPGSTAHSCTTASVSVKQRHQALEVRSQVNDRGMLRATSSVACVCCGVYPTVGERRDWWIRSNVCQVGRGPLGCWPPWALRVSAAPGILLRPCPSPQNVPRLCHMSPCLEGAERDKTEWGQRGAQGLAEATWAGQCAFLGPYSSVIPLRVGHLPRHGRACPSREVTARRDHVRFLVPAAACGPEPFSQWPQAGHSGGSVLA